MCYKPPFHSLATGVYNFSTQKIASDIFYVDNLHRQDVATSSGSVAVIGGLRGWWRPAVLLIDDDSDSDSPV
jgi:hypothetical protein